ncbi:hypothetical protein BCR35DRAFT_47605 [Leucosporidium creatinivorum]|uniref:Uncharacterized protein n=1 Tax=Leucosporidium creatinivorum TaxID=106004 RepID=A0A1Y2BZJ1_9BASI|nr:hypothetical protein BCR35DRAFT_47605 [Leucosporidium creatinivorum]
MLSLRSTTLLRLRTFAAPQLRTLSTSRAVFAPEGKGETKSAATNSENPAAKRGEVLKNAAKSAGQAVKEAFGGNGEVSTDSARFSPSRPRTVSSCVRKLTLLALRIIAEQEARGNGASGKDKGSTVLPRDHVEEQMDKGKAAGGTRRE